MAMRIELQPVEVKAAQPVRHARERDARPVPQAQPVHDAEARRADAQQLREAMAEANRRLAQIARELTFEFDETAGRIVVRLVDRTTREVLRQIPSEQALALARALRDEAVRGALLRADA
jgi:flagellar protein FlaG